MYSISEFLQVAMTVSEKALPRLDECLGMQSSSGFEQNGSTFALNSDGRIVHAEYASGAGLRRHDFYAIARSADGVHWYINKRGMVLALD